MDFHDAAPVIPGLTAEGRRENGGERGHGGGRSAYDRQVQGDQDPASDVSAATGEGFARDVPSAEKEQPALGASRGVTSVGAADLRRLLQLTPHQLGELTSRLRLEIGDRPNYPRYRRAEVHLLTATLALREIRVPLEDACEAVVAFADYLLAGDGWLVLHPSGDQWVALAARTLPAVGSLLLLASRASVLDAAAVRHRNDRTWSRLLTENAGSALV